MLTHFLVMRLLNPEFGAFVLIWLIEMVTRWNTVFCWESHQIIKVFQIVEILLLLMLQLWARDFRIQASFRSSLVLICRVIVNIWFLDVNLSFYWVNWESVASRGSLWLRSLVLQRVWRYFHRAISISDLRWQIMSVSTRSLKCWHPCIWICLFIVLYYLRLISIPSVSSNVSKRIKAERLDGRLFIYKRPLNISCFLAAYTLTVLHGNTRYQRELSVWNTLARRAASRWREERILI